MAERTGVPVFVGDDENGFYPLGEVPLLELHRVPDTITELLPGVNYATRELVIDADERPYLLVTVTADDDFGADVERTLGLIFGGAA